MNYFPILGVAFFGFLLGARHGLDWDHFAAIADLVGAPGQHSRRSLALALYYCIGHGAVIVLLGAMVGILGMRLPGGIDRVFEVLVGATLVALGLLVLWQVWHQGPAYRFIGRWRLLIDLLRRVWLRRRGEVDWYSPVPLSKNTAFGIGVLHGTGAETPTQVVLFASAAAAGSSSGAGLVLMAFVLGLIASDLSLALILLSGRFGAGRIQGGQMVMGAITGLASLGVGLAFILQKSAVLPSLLGG